MVNELLVMIFTSASPSFTVNSFLEVGDGEGQKNPIQSVLLGNGMSCKCVQNSIHERFSCPAPN